MIKGALLWDLRHLFAIFDQTVSQKALKQLRDVLQIDVLEVHDCQSVHEFVLQLLVWWLVSTQFRKKEHVFNTFLGALLDVFVQYEVQGDALGWVSRIYTFKGFTR